MSFPKDFIWGAATASYQIEGAALEDGRGECIWHRFSHTPGKVFNGDTGDVACDHYHRYYEDVALMKDLGLRGYRFSISWPRVISAGTGLHNPAGLDFYDRLVDSLLEANIIPFVTLYHWDLPQALQDRGGWVNPDSVQWFSDYAGLMASQLGDRVKHWATFNEPRVVSHEGFLTGKHAPGIQNLPKMLQVAHHLLLAHGAAVPVIREQVNDAEVGVVLDLYAVDPMYESDAEAAAIYDGFRNRWFLDPVFRGSYPEDVAEVLDDALADIDLGAIQAAQVPLDFVGLNYYFRLMVEADEQAKPLPLQAFTHPDSPITAMGWEIYPEGLYRLLTRLHQEYGTETIYVTENGVALDDPTPNQGIVEDPQRVAYLEQHFDAAARAIQDGVPLKGYFVWSLMDNFEWSFGFSKRFGLIYIDYETLERIPKRSALYYKGKIAQ